jgi:antitoxin component of RelBE/YafQ-DinJ toxin-antitoxin module
MIYIAIDNTTTTAKKMIQLIEEMPFATVYREFNKTTIKAFKEVKDGKTIKAKNTNDLLQKLKQ